MTYTEDAIYAAAKTLLRQASDATEDGNGFPSDTGPGSEFESEEWTQRVADEVPYLTEAVTAFIDASYVLLYSDGVSASEAGHNFVLSAGHHGTGFWDRGYPHGDELHEACDEYSLNAEFALNDDGEVAWLMVGDTVLADNLSWAS